MSLPPSLAARFENLFPPLAAACLHYYGGSLISLAVFGSAGRGTPRPDSDIDLLIVAEGLPQGRVRRVADFGAVEEAMRPVLLDARAAGLAPELSPVIKTPAEVLQGSPLFLDLTTDARVLYDREGFLRSALDQLKAKLERLGARRIWRGNAWFWDLKPDFKPGDVIEL